MKKIIKIIMFSVAFSPTLLAETQTSNSFIAEYAERFLTTGVILGELFILLLILYYWKKTKEDSKVDTNKLLKRNIKLLRNEKVLNRVDTRNNGKRKSLINEFNFKRVNGKSITNKAKKLSISKGELFLAARIHQLSNRTR